MSIFLRVNLFICEKIVNKHILDIRRPIPRGITINANNNDPLQGFRQTNREDEWLPWPPIVYLLRLKILFIFILAWKH